MCLGNRVTNQDFEGATFAELGNAPANLESGRFADAYGCSRGNASQYADAIQAYLQAKMTGDKCWIELPREAHPGEIWGTSRYRAQRAEQDDSHDQSVLPPGCRDVARALWAP